MALADCHAKIKKIENEFSAAYINIELQRCKVDETKSQDLAEFFHKGTQAWIQARQHLSKIGDRLPEGTLTEGEMKEIFASSPPEESKANAVRKTPLEDLRSVHEKVYALRKILEGKLKIKLENM